jgi:hypothetical protein
MLVDARDPLVMSSPDLESLKVLKMHGSLNWV